MQFEIYDKATGLLVMPIQLDALHEVGNYTFDLYEYRDVTPSADAPPAQMPAPIFGGKRQLTKLEWRKLLLPAEEQAFDEVRATVETMALPDAIPRALVRTFVNRYNEATVMDLDDHDQADGFKLLVALGKMNPSRIPVILNG